MNKIIKLIQLIILIICSTSISYSVPCYTDTTLGCDDNEAIYVATTNTNYGYCIEYLDEQK